MPERSDLKTCDLTPKHRRMRKTELEPEHYDIQGKGCLVTAIIGIVAIVITLIALCSCGQVKKTSKCEAYHSGNPRTKRYNN